MHQSTNHTPAGDTAVAVRVVALPAVPTAARLARRAVMAELSHLPRRIVDDVVLAVSELVSNAVNAAEQGTTVELGTAKEPDSVAITVKNRTDHGRDLSKLFATPSLPTPDVLSGRGLAIVSQLADSLRVRHEGPMTVVEARFSIAPSADPGGAIRTLSQEDSNEQPFS